MKIKTWTPKQVKALQMLKRDVPNTFLYGGARSGKTIAIIAWMVHQCGVYEGLRMLVARLRFSHARSSLWHESLVDVLSQVPKKSYRLNKADWYIEFNTGSEIWLGGFDEKERTEKILGHEYNVIYFNEISQYGYDVIEMALPRLARKVEGFQNRAIYDCNPPSPLHWSHRIFIEGVEPRTRERLQHPEQYQSLKMNPEDNRENLADGYIEQQLLSRSERYKRRFYYGEFVKAEGTIYDEFDELRHICSKENLPQMERYSIGVDFGLNMATVLIGWSGDHIYCIADMGAYGTTSSQFNTRIVEEWGDKLDMARVWCDPSAGERIQEITNGDKANNSVEPGIDYIQNKMHNDEFHVCEDCTGILSEIWDYRRDEKEKVIKQNDHYMDSMRYGIFSEVAEPVQIFI